MDNNLKRKAHEAELDGDDTDRSVRVNVDLSADPGPPGSLNGDLR